MRFSTDKYKLKGSGKIGEKNGIHFDQYERNPGDDGIWMSKKSKSIFINEEKSYIKAKKKEKRRKKKNNNKYSKEGYKLEGFIVKDSILCDEE